MQDILKSKSMVGFLVIIISITFISTNQVQTYENDYNSEITLEN